MTRVRRKRVHKNNKEFRKSIRTRRRPRDLDQIYEDIHDPAKNQKMTNQPEDEDLPGLGQFYCLECARYFEGPDHLSKHKLSKQHKQRVRELKDEPYTHEEAEAAAGMGRAIKSPSQVNRPLGVTPLLAGLGAATPASVLASLNTAAPTAPPQSDDHMSHN
ncbi:hypothetical protein H696_04099 [Fonticula alba]|uniref:C2H2-type domain-containing protein n=1 Tax=Fonticula alba TaxID=691883 RepID=A0A058Z837_FONAL|nr:hypothetical protein H696_04099 [Fonticula alba]KCV69692.1 hypothetical protein H696_04099 [Fonticula alba]|eukprot:XP_009496257.1 hypothetical protein H696_04099 [Fonticula alba]